MYKGLSFIVCLTIVWVQSLSSWKPYIPIVFLSPFMHVTRDILVQFERCFTGKKFQILISNYSSLTQMETNQWRIMPLIKLTEKPKKCLSDNIISLSICNVHEHSQNFKNIATDLPLWKKSDMAAKRKKHPKWWRSSYARNLIVFNNFHVERRFPSIGLH